MPRQNLTRPVAPTDALTTTEMATWLKMSTRSIERHFQSFAPGRYLAAHALPRIDEMLRSRQIPRAEA